MLQCEGFSSKLRYYFEIPNGENVGNWAVNVVLKFHDDPTVNESEIVIFLKQFGGLREKERVLRGEGKKRK